ncbi:hypothetical protein [Amycolatopsis thermoflava]|uniref:hypothetical protein n=1 Tax=Amycolatopsis thermoflava TaxID=84480 RepID=UPI00365F87E6
MSVNISATGRIDRLDDQPLPSWIVRPPRRRRVEDPMTFAYREFQRDPLVKDANRSRESYHEAHDGTITILSSGETLPPEPGDDPAQDVRRP